MQTNKYFKPTTIEEHYQVDAEIVNKIKIFKENVIQFNLAKTFSKN